MSSSSRLSSDVQSIVNLSKHTRQATLWAYMLVQCFSASVGAANKHCFHWWLPSQRRFPLLMIAPEGTTKSGHCLLRFLTGAFVPGASPCKSAHGKVPSV